MDSSKHYRCKPGLYGRQMIYTNLFNGESLQVHNVLQRDRETKLVKELKAMHPIQCNPWFPIHSKPILDMS